MNDYIEMKRDDERGWWFDIESTAASCSEQVEEIIQHLDGLYDAFDDFIVPKKVNVVYRILREDLPLSDMSTELREATPGYAYTKTLESEDGVGKTEVHQIIEKLRQQPLYVRTVRFKENDVKMELESGTHYIGRSDPRYVDPKYPPNAEKEPLFGPIRPYKLSISDTKRGMEEGFPYYLPVRVHSDIWFADSWVGRRNRQNLIEFLESIETYLPVRSVEREPPDRLEQLKSIY